MTTSQTLIVGWKDGVAITETVDERTARLSAQANLLLGMLAACFRENDCLLFCKYDQAEAIGKIAKIVEGTGRTVWNGT